MESILTVKGIGPRVYRQELSGKRVRHLNRFISGLAKDQCE